MRRVRARSIELDSTRASGGTGYFLRECTGRCESATHRDRTPRVPALTMDSVIVRARCEFHGVHEGSRQVLGRCSPLLTYARFSALSDFADFRADFLLAAFGTGAPTLASEIAIDSLWIASMAVSNDSCESPRPVNSQKSDRNF